MDKLKKVLHEIHRRSLWQVLGVYGAGSWAALEISDALTEAAGLPGWFPSFALGLLVLGLPVVLATAMVGGGGRRPGPDHDVFAAPEGSRSLLRWRNVALGGVGAAALWGVVATVLLVRGAGAPPSGASADETDGARPPLLAVLPMANLTGRPDLQYLADGLHDEILTRVQQAGGLRVISRTSVLRYRDTGMTIPAIAGELGADVVLESSLRSAGERIRATAQLIDGVTDEHLWAETYDRTFDPESLFTVQTDLALTITDALTESIGTEERARVTRVGTDDPEAQRLYLLGLFYRSRARPGDLQAAMDAFRDALELDPDFASAWAALSEAYMVIAHGFTPPWVAFPEGEEAARRALALEPDLAAAHTTLADVAYHYGWDWEGSEAGFRRALALNPSHATAHWWLAGLLSTLRRHDEAVREARAALPLDPGGVTHWFVARIHMWAGRLDEARELVDEGLRVTPNHPFLLAERGIHRVRWGGTEGERQAGLRDLERAAGMGPGEAPFLRAVGLALVGREAEARSLLDTLGRASEGVYVPRYYLAKVRAELGDTRAALELLEEAAENRDAPFIWVGVDPEFRSLGDEPRFQALLERMGLSPARFDERGVPVPP